MVTGVDLAEEARELGCGVAGQGPECAPAGDVDADDAAADREEDDDQEADGAGLGAGDLVADFCEGESGVGEGVEVDDGVEDCDEVRRAR